MREGLAPFIFRHNWKSEWRHEGKGDTALKQSLYFQGSRVAACVAAITSPNNATIIRNINGGDTGTDPGVDFFHRRNILVLFFPILRDTFQKIKCMRDDRLIYKFSLIDFILIFDNFRQEKAVEATKQKEDFILIQNTEGILTVQVQVST
jgi:hypothetical protein